MNAAEVVVGEVEAIRAPQVLPLLAEGIRQSREAAHLHSDREVLAFNVRGANSLRIGIAHDWDSLRVRDFGGAVLAFAFRVVGVDCRRLTVLFAGGDTQALHF